MILTDTEIRALCADLAPNVKRINPMLEPFSEGVQGNNVISFGLSHAGYDMRLGSTVLIFKNTFNEVIDPKKFKNDPKYHSRLFDKIEDIPTGEQVMIPPHSYILGYTLEYIRMPNNLKGRCVGKSTLARCGVVINTTPIEPGWEGHLTLEIANVTPCPLVVYCGEGICQIEFEMLTGVCNQDYAAKGNGGGKYQGQRATPVPARTVE